MKIENIRIDFLPLCHYLLTFRNLECMLIDEILHLKGWSFWSVNQSEFQSTYFFSNTVSLRFPPSISLFHSCRLSTHFAIEFEFRTLKDSDINKYLIKVIVKR